MNDLKPCPFCGEPEDLIIEHLDGSVRHPAYAVKCDNCGGMMSYTSYGHVDSWNRRVPVPPVSPPSLSDSGESERQPTLTPTNAHQSMTTIRKQALELYEGPFVFDSGYIYDSKRNVVADYPAEDAALRIRGWGRIGRMPNAEDLQDEVGKVIAEAMTAYWQSISTQGMKKHG